MTKDALREAQQDIASLEETLSNVVASLMTAKRQLQEQGQLRSQLEAQQELAATAAAAAAACLASPAFAPSSPPENSAPSLLPRFSLLPCSAVLGIGVLSACLAALLPLAVESVQGLAPPGVAPALQSLWPPQHCSQALQQYQASPHAASGTLHSLYAYLFLSPPAPPALTLPCLLLSRTASYLPFLAGALLLRTVALYASSSMLAVVAGMVGAAACLGLARPHPPGSSWPHRLYSVREWWAAGDWERAMCLCALALALGRLVWAAIVACLFGGSTAILGEAGTLERLGLAGRSGGQGVCAAFCTASLSTTLGHAKAALALATLAHLAVLHGGLASSSLPPSSAHLSPLPLALWWVTCALAELVWGLRALFTARSARLRFLLLLDRCSLASQAMAKVPDTLLLVAAQERQAAAAARRAGSALIVGLLGVLGCLPGFPWEAQEIERSRGRRACLLSVLTNFSPAVLSGAGGGGAKELCLAGLRGLQSHPEDLLAPVFAAYCLIMGL